MLSYLNVAIVKIPFRSRVMDFSNNHLSEISVFVLMGKGIFDWQQWYWGAIDATSRADDLWSGNAHTDYING